MVELLNSFSWDIILAAVGTIIATIIGIWQVKHALPKRTHLKTDLEIMQLIGKEHEQYWKIKEQTEMILADIYTKPQLTNVEKGKLLAFKVSCAILSIIFSYLTYYYIRGGWSWWCLLTGYFGLASLYWIFISPQNMIIRRSRRNILEPVSTRNPMGRRTGSGL